MKTLGVILLFLCSLLCLGGAVAAQADELQPRMVDSHPLRPAATDAGSRRGRPGEDDPDEEAEEDVVPVTPLHWIEPRAIEQSMLARGASQGL
jgi:hypothetical protein